LKLLIFTEFHKNINVNFKLIPIDRHAYFVFAVGNWAPGRVKAEERGALTELGRDVCGA